MAGNQRLGARQRGFSEADGIGPGDGHRIGEYRHGIGGDAPAVQPGRRGGVDFRREPFKTGREEIRCGGTLERRREKFHRQYRLVRVLGERKIIIVAGHDDWRVIPSGRGAGVVPWIHDDDHARCGARTKIQ